VADKTVKIGELYLSNFLMVAIPFHMNANCSNQQSKKEANSGALMPSHGRSGHGDWAWGCTTRRVLRSW
jgi:hypothetical protein